jgi:hypothetical protein
MTKIKRCVLMMIKKNACWALGLTLLVSLPSMGHHSAAMFDHDVELTLSGQVEEFEYVNPHSWLSVNIENEDGSHTTWGFELGAPTRLRAVGIPPTFWRPGDRVTVKTNPLKDGRPAGALVGSIGVNGKTYGNIEGLTASD